MAVQLLAEHSVLSSYDVSEMTGVSPVNRVHVALISASVRLTVNLFSDTVMSKIFFLNIL